MKEETIKIDLNKKIVTLKVTRFETDIDMDDLLKIDYANILGEILTFPVLVNRIGILRVEMEDLVRQEKFNLEVENAKLSEMYRKEDIISYNSKNETVKKKPTINEIENKVSLDPSYQNSQKRLFRLQKNFAYVDSLYWSAKSKDDKLNKLSSFLRPEEFEKEIVEGIINGIMIKVHEKLIN